MASRKAAPPPPSPRNTTKAALKYVKAGWDYETREPGELGFVAGELIKVTSEHPSGWWFGEIDGRSGTFPSNYTEPCNLFPQEKFNKRFLFYFFFIFFLFFSFFSFGIFGIGNHQTTDHHQSLQAQ